MKSQTWLFLIGLLAIGSPVARADGKPNFVVVLADDCT
ncbi:unnamed protein product, partial [marine sediment metagenome]